MNFFDVLTKYTLSPRSVRLILNFAYMLQDRSEYSLLHQLFSEYVFPKIIVGPLKLSTVAQP